MALLIIIAASAGSNGIDRNSIARTTTAPSSAALAQIGSSADALTATPAPTPAPTPTPKRVVPNTPTAGPVLSPTRQPPVVRRTAPHLMVIMEENKGYAATLGSCSADPYWCSLASQYASDTSWFGVGHPSAPNYLAIVSGSAQGVTNDCTPPGCGPFGATSLGGQLTAAGIPWIDYQESMSSACYTGGGSGSYAEKHNGFMYFNDVRSVSSCASHVRPYPGSGAMVSALTGGSAPSFVWITPNLNDDMHDGSVQQGDAWLRSNLGPVLASPWFTGGSATVIVTMDEGTGGNQIPMVVISSKARGAGAVAVNGNHYGTLRAIEETYGLALLGGAASRANGDLVSLFGGPA